MSVGETLAAAGLLGFAGWFTARVYLASRSTLIHGFANRGAILSGSLMLAGGYVVLVASRYAAIGAALEVSTTEADFFAVQTLTTVGYGGGLALLGEKVPTATVDAFRRFSSWAMLSGSIVWGVAIAAVANVIFPPAVTAEGRASTGG